MRRPRSGFVFVGCKRCVEGFLRLHRIVAEVEQRVQRIGEKVIGREGDLFELSACLRQTFTTHLLEY
jgi:hypothetical protein